jgi:hypothetical protein
MPIKKGDLVCMYRRKTKGIGIVLKCVEDVGEAIDIKAQEVLEKLQDIKDLGDITTAYQIQSDIIKNSPHKDLATDFFMYNDGWNTKVKLQFAYVKWFSRPSDYSARQVYRDTEWYPMEWLKTIDGSQTKTP